MTTINRKRVRLIQKINDLQKSYLLMIKLAPKGSSDPTTPEFDPEAIYVSRKTLIKLLQKQEPADSDYSFIVPAESQPRSKS